MQLALLAGSNPKKAASEGPKVRLRKGSWSVEHEGMKDSTLIIHVLTPRSAPLVDEVIRYEYRADSPELILRLDHPAFVHVVWMVRGTEQNLNLYASYVKEQ